jgi:hypothetical protein
MGKMQSYLMLKQELCKVTTVFRKFGQLNLNVHGYSILVQDFESTSESIKNRFSTIVVLDADCVGIVTESNHC